MFEIGLVLAGAVSAGAYTAGVLDYLTEALDAWEKAKASEIQEKGPDPKNWSIPGHKIRIRVLSGASAGSMCGAILAVASHWDFPHVNALNHEDVGADNPFFAAWVKGIDIIKLLGDSDLNKEEEPSRVVSILNSDPIIQIGQNALSYRCQKPIDRNYLENPMRYIFTLTNLRGVQYFIPQKGPEDFWLTAHSDYRRFAVFKANDAEGVVSYADELTVNCPNSSDDLQWKELLASAVASGAFPVGLACRDINRPAEEYRHRKVVAPGCTGQGPEALPLNPVIPADSDPFKFAAVDGGAMDNEPLELARTELSGIMGCNPRSGADARRAVILVDPFPNLPEEGPVSADLLDVLSAPFKLFSAWKNQARFKPVDVALALDSTIYSRFAVYPWRKDGNGKTVSGDRAIASGALGGFSGFLLEDYRLHDYLLGRMNCQSFLRDVFTIPQENPVVVNFWSSTARNDERFFSLDENSLAFANIVLSLCWVSAKIPNNRIPGPRAGSTRATKGCRACCCQDWTRSSRPS